jgi:hypothetical protein
MIFIGTKEIQGFHRAQKATPETDAYAQYAVKARKDYLRRVKAYYYDGKDLPDDVFETTNPAASGQLIKPGEGEQSTPTTSTELRIVAREKELARVEHDIVVAQKRLAVVAKGENFDPPLAPNAVQPYGATLLGFEQARSDCRSEMIKIVHEVKMIQESE